MSIRTTAAHFAVADTRLDGKRGGTLTIEPEGHGSVTFRPTGSHKAYSLPLAFACELIAWRAAKLEAQKGTGR
jgi:hypothetical protein